VYARAAVAANHPTAAWGSLSQFARMVQNYPQAEKLVAAMLEIAETLPEEYAQNLRTRLRPQRPAAALRASDP
jgi:hypothetical protein